MDVEIVIPVYNEELGLARSVRRLHGFLADGFPFSWRITIADNASADSTLAIARKLERELPGVGVVHVDAKGCGPFGRRGSQARRGSSATWTSISRPTCTRCCRWSPQ